PNKTGDQWITIQSAALDHLPAPGQRVGPDDAAFMPKITSPGLGEAALGTAPGAHNFRFVGIEFLPATQNAFIYDLIDFGDGSSAQNSLSQVPHDLTLDQCYVHAWLDQPLKRGIALNSANTSIVNSYIAGFKVDGQDSQAIAGWNGPGPFKIDNNYVEAAGENILFGGAATSINGLIPSDIEIRNNLISKPLAWNQNDPTTYAGTHWSVKNLLELKNAQRVTIDGNRFEHNWVDGQAGFAIVMTPRGDQSGGPWVTVSNVTFTNNAVVGTAQGINILGSDDASASQPAANILIQNNYFDDFGTAPWGDPGNSRRLFQLLTGRNGGSKYVTIDHNVATSDGTIIMAEGVHTGLVFTNNTTPHGQYGVFVAGKGEGMAALQTAFPGYTFQGNLILGAQAKAYPTGNFYGTTPNEHLVMQMYQDLLQRTVDATGMAAWTAALAQGSSPVQIAQAIEASSEFRTVEVQNLYTTLLHRAADPSGLSVYTAFLAGGGTIEQVAEILTGSQEYYLTQGSGTNDRFLDALYRDVLGRAVDLSGRTTYDADLAGQMERVQITAAVFTSVEFEQNLIGTFYQRYLHRSPDSGGLNAFVGFLHQGTRDEEVIAAIIGSAEYTAHTATV
ncbi:MAG TPA: DUF4214 domain-containing protein, partial [Gemmataceae bacterium]|nr:DUF4214 domain-containing protein [Gemmataceae bacterium]